MDRNQENQTISAEDFESFASGFANEATGTNRGNNAFNMTEFMTSINQVMNQNAMVLQALMNNQQNQIPQRNYAVIPDFSKTISDYAGEDLDKSKSWLESLESAATLHHWPDEFILETARSKLTGAALHWYEAR
ncbi:unnamed protein product [Ceutorhynchus assimilis]|uniref:Uncharacterized protein n=1 Tax=Ceutorhynchus assimilis TaxID=467358 RepID=A0A9N9MIT1_9CUCU|nr:unnamed protein product [Ceutorhynchus assimilis]